MDNPEPRAQYLNVVLRQIDRTSLRIPRFQRNFVWGERDVLELLGSIEKGYPIGSVLTWKVDASEDYFSGYRVGPFPEANETVSGFEVILDGAQRLSSLYGCLKNAEANEIYRVYYDLRNREFVHASSIAIAGPWFVPMDAIFDSRRFLAVQSRIAELEDSEELLPRALDLYSTFQDYQIPIIALSNAQLEDVVEVFRRVNSSGTPLSSVDFVRALTWRSSFDLEETFEAFAERYQASPIEGFSEDFLIRCLAITGGLSLDSRDIVQLKTLSNRHGGLADEVAEMSRALDRMVEFLQRLDIRGIRDVPYEVQRLLLFGLMHYDARVAPEQIESWFWRSTFAEEHQSKPESYTTRLINAMRDGDFEATFEVRKPIEWNLFALRPRRGGSAVTVGFDLLLRNRRARSLLSGADVATSDVFHGRLFSNSELGIARDGSAGASGLLANMVPLSQQDAAEWRRLRTGTSLEEMFAICDDRTGDAEAIWSSQGISRPDEATPMNVLIRRSNDLLRPVLQEPR